MRFPVFFGTKPKLSMDDMDNFSRGKYQCRVLLQNKNGCPVVISEHQDTGVWKVTHGFSTVVFGSKAEALAYCKNKFLDLDGRPFRNKETT